MTVPSMTESRSLDAGALGRQLLVVVALVVMIATNVLANALPLNNQTTGEISGRFPIYFEPAGYVFSIWGLIYLGLIVYAIYRRSGKTRGCKRLPTRLFSAAWPTPSGSSCGITTASP
jgi:hypothetical protein